MSEVIRIISGSVPDSLYRKFQEALSVSVYGATRSLFIRQIILMSINLNKEAIAAIFEKPETVAERLNFIVQVPEAKSARKDSLHQRV